MSHDNCISEVNFSLPRSGIPTPPGAENEYCIETASEVLRVVEIEVCRPVCDENCWDVDLVLVYELFMDSARNILKLMDNRGLCEIVVDLLDRILRVRLVS